MTWAGRLGLTRDELPALLAGAFVTFLAVAASTRIGEPLILAALIALGVFFLVVVAFIAVPHISIAAMIPLFVVLPSLKVLLVPWIGPLKDVIGLAAISAGATIVVQQASAGRKLPGDLWITLLVGFLIGLYLVNLGGGLQRDLAWAHGVRLFSEPLLLLLVGMTLKHPRRTLRWAMTSLIATACVVATIGVLQQVVGPARLVQLGYEYDIHVRFVGNHLRSFGTLDEPFAYAALLLFGLAGVFMWMRRGILAAVAGSIIGLGLLFSFVRSAAMVLVALAALWLAKHGRMVQAGFLTAIVIASAIVLIAGEQAEQRRTVRGGDSVYITINGRTEAWKVVFDNPWDLPLGKGVGEVGTAAERATFSISRTAEEARAHEGSVVDSGYFATVADIGLVGLAALLMLLGRLVVLGYRATRVGERTGWLTLSFLTILLLDAVTRESFSGFPTAFLGLLIVGVTLAAAVEDTPDAF
ncbi:MAG TPA: hypothetical protein VFO03_04280, partial [Gaiellaceae bacterium]|nr:hypothetical protein [Gaiellaceae bacterium]